MSDKTHYRETKYGFEFGPASVVRLFSSEKHGVSIEISTEREVIQVRATPTGFIRLGRVIKKKGGSKHET